MSETRFCDRKHNIKEKPSDTYFDLHPDGVGLVDGPVVYRPEVSVPGAVISLARSAAAEECQQDDQEKLHNSLSSFWKRVSMAGLHGAASRRLLKASSPAGDRLPEGSFLRPPMETLCLYWGGVRSRTYALISSRLETSPNGSITLHRSSAFCGSRSLPSLLIYGCVQPVASQRNACVFPSRFIAARNVLAKLILGIVTFFPGVANECLTFISKRNKTSPMNRYIQIPLSDDAEEKIQERKLVEVFLSIATATLKRTDHPALSAVAEKWEAHLIKAEEDLK